MELEECGFHDKVSHQKFPLLLSAFSWKQLLRNTQSFRILHHGIIKHTCVLPIAPTLSANFVISGDQSSKCKWGPQQRLPLWAQRERGWGTQQAEQPCLSQKYQQVRHVLTTNHTKVKLESATDVSNSRPR